MTKVRFGHLADIACVQLGEREARNFSLIRWFRLAIRRFSIFAAKNALQQIAFRTRVLPPSSRPCHTKRPPYSQGGLFASHPLWHSAAKRVVMTLTTISTDRAVERRATNSRIVKRSIIRNGHKSSVSLEDQFWECLREIAKSKMLTMSKLVEEIDQHRNGENLSSAIRVFVLEYYQNVVSLNARRD